MCGVPTISEVRDRYEQQLMALPNVIGVAEASSGGTAVIQILVTHHIDDLALPTELDGYRVEIVEVGEIQPRA